METNAFFQSKEVLDFNKELQNYHLGPLWSVIPEIMHKEPKPDAVPYLWKWETIEKKLQEATEIFTPDRGGERRAIYLANPGTLNRKPWGWASTTNTLYAAVQLILPGEVAPSHRHTQSALRFIQKGKGAYSTVQGQRLFMEEGDFLTTPKGLWHGHGHEGTDPMYWMDCLDIPFIYSTGATFFEPHPEKLESPSLPDNYGARKYQGGMVRPIGDRNRQDAPLGSYKWTQTEAALEGLSAFEPDPFDGTAVEFINPSTGQTANPTIAAWMQLLPTGFHSKAHRHTNSAIYHVYKGEGYTVIDGIRYDWSEGDYFVVPNWAWHEHVNLSTKEALLFSTNDLPIMEMLGLQQEEVYPRNQGYQEIKGEFAPLFA
ncbi:cupin domain-containing protein [Halalkalibacterium halodurans]|uniref:Gentisate 1,2-dioxygenase n=1 Tax=Halalkalibacterium halodurans (strain ATCC BAA-125 / DSM 18197 / FERM 7344 / JCM 9153 / C-125) TaxID=272558 RepID=Q9KBC6_HALH5|nr:cupin domain-containing protein [Halalkalibacterium halodurans]MDY7222561.1 cupin domain-containing protein [Halalkalibacterium halodurans]MDY7241782.1 cupin domain-containing protein [Halalkalibacterium halodurans]MED4123964.1 cupin domain-containing protein [Halalkalibacterium halodurans]BAB05721.1 gentisate 1,2-dioxygenase [Halalkalibacterium halodurans C-125]